MQSFIMKQRPMQSTQQQQREEPSTPSSPFKRSLSSPLSPTQSYRHYSQYITRQFANKIRTRDLPLEKNAQGIVTPVGLFFLAIRLTVPLTYIYIALLLLRELTDRFPHTLLPLLQYYLPTLATFTTETLHKSSLIVEIWIVLEACFYICSRLHIRYLQFLDPLEASLSAAPILEIYDRKVLWTQMMHQVMNDDPIIFIRGWFFDHDLDSITKYDVMDFVSWSMFEGRNLEHLTREEKLQLGEFVDELEWRIGIYMFGMNNEQHYTTCTTSTTNSSDIDGNDTAVESTPIRRQVKQEEIFYSPKGTVERHDEEEDENIIDNHRDENDHLLVPDLSCPPQVIRSSYSNGTATTIGTASTASPSPLITTTNDASPTTTTSTTTTSRLKIIEWNRDANLRIKPKKEFHFQDCSNDEGPNYFTNLYENYKTTYEQYRQRLEIGDFHPVLQDIKNYVSTKRQQLTKAEEQAKAAASHMCEHAYFTLVDRGSDFDKKMNALSSATHQQFNDAWNSVSKMTERLETANFISSRKQQLSQQLRGYTMLLDRMRNMSTGGGGGSGSIPAKQMAGLMRKITNCNNALDLLEHSAKKIAYATGFASKNLGMGGLKLIKKDPQRYAKYSNDPLLGLATYPLMFNLLILGWTDGWLRVIMKTKGFQRFKIGSTSYYYHPGKSVVAGASSNTSGGGQAGSGGLGGLHSNHSGSRSSLHSLSEDGESEKEKTPIVFCHGIGIGLGYYMQLIDELVELDRPLLLPEIPYVCGFRPWIKRNSILTPAQVVTTLTEMLACHGFLKATFIGHSYGTSWLSYMCKYASNTLVSVVFIDPICFCLHHPCLTKSFVYHRPDPGSVSYIVKTDVVVNWTIQRGFPWSRIVLFVEDIPKNVSCSIFLSELDVLIPFKTVEKYLGFNGAKIDDFDKVLKKEEEHYSHPLNVTIFRGEAHGDWTTIDSKGKGKVIANAAQILTSRYKEE